MEKKFKITGMRCQSCARKIEGGVGAMAGIERAGVNLIMEVLTVEIDEGIISAGEIIEKIKYLGFGAEEIIPEEKNKVEEVSVGIKGLGYQSCVRKIESNMNKVEGIERIEVNLTTEKAKINYNGKKIKMSEIKQGIEDLGFEIVTEKVPTKEAFDEKKEKLVARAQFR